MKNEPKCVFDVIIRKVFIVDKHRLILSLIIIIVITLMASSITWGDDWVCFSWNKDTSECQNYYNKRVKYKKHIVQVLTRLPITDDVRATIDSLKDDDSHMIISKVFDCKNETVSVMETIVYKTDGMVSSSVDGDVSVKHQITFDSRDGSLFKVLCKKTRK